MYQQKIILKETKTTSLPREKGKDKTRTKAGVHGMNKTLWHNTKGDADYKTHEGNGEQVDTIREDTQTGDT